METNGSNIVYSYLRRKLIGKLSNKEVGQILIRYLPEREVWYISMDVYGEFNEQHILNIYELVEEKYKEFLQRVEKHKVLSIL